MIDNGGVWTPEQLPSACKPCKLVRGMMCAVVWIWCSGVLKFKRESEQFLQSSGLPYTILRPSRLTDGPYTSYDLNTLLQVSLSMVGIDLLGGS